MGGYGFSQRKLSITYARSSVCESQLNNLHFIFKMLMNLWVI